MMKSAQKHVFLFILLWFFWSSPAAAQVPLSGTRPAGVSSGIAGGNSAEEASARLQMRLDATETALQSYIAEVENLRNEIKKLNARIDRQAADTDVRFSLLEKKAEGAAPEKASAPPAEEKPAGRQDDAKTLYEKGHSAIRGSKFDEAEAAFSRLLTLYPNDELAGNAQYWLGETYYVRGDYENAAGAFAEGFKKYRKNAKGPDNLLKLGLSMQRLGKKKEACAAYNSLKKEFPQAPESILKRAEASQKTAQCEAAEKAPGAKASPSAASGKPKPASSPEKK